MKAQKTDRTPSGCLEAVTAGADFSYDEAATAADVIALAGKGRPTLIALNLEGREDSGISVCRELVRAESTRDVPILAIAGAAADRQVMIALSVLPCDSDTLDRVIHRIMDRVH